MPELPEVETLRRSLERRVLGARITAVWTSGKPLRMRRAVDTRGLRGATGEIIALRRLAKYLLLDVEGGRSIIIHLGMTGRVLASAATAPRAPHTHIVWSLADGRELRFVDARRFGWVTTTSAGHERAKGELRVLGVEPLSAELTVERLAALLGSRRRPLKSFLLDQSLVAGLGNIYVCEALFHARLHPLLRSDRVGARAGALRQAIVAVLRGAIANRGTTLRDYVDGDGRSGRNQLRLHVYGREGKPCTRCRATIERAVDAGRSTFYCPGCQAR
jgi:formamidopyrimidine-DNA glycosylase